MFLFWRNVSLLRPRISCAMCSWYYNGGSGKKKIFYSIFFVMISPLKIESPTFEKKWHFFIQDCYCNKLGWNWHSRSGVKTKMWKVFDNNDGKNNDGQQTNFAHKNSLEHLTQVSSNAFVWFLKMHRWK